MDKVKKKTTKWTLPRCLTRISQLRSHTKQHLLPSTLAPQPQSFSLSLLFFRWYLFIYWNQIFYSDSQSFRYCLWFNFLQWQSFSSRHRQSPPFPPIPNSKFSPFLNVSSHLDSMLPLATSTSSPKNRATCSSSPRRTLTLSSITIWRKSLLFTGESRWFCCAGFFKLGRLSAGGSGLGSSMDLWSDPVRCLR